MYNFLRMMTKRILFPFCFLTLFFLGGAIETTITSGQNNHKATRSLESIPFNYDHFTPKNISNKDVWQKFNPEYQDHPDFGKSFYFTPHKSNIEIISKRTENEKFYVNPNRPTEFFQQKGYEAVHYKKGNEWITIDTRISPIGDGIYEASNQVEPVGFDRINKYSYIKTASSAKVRFNSWRLYGENASGTVELIAEPNWSNFSAGDDGVYIKEIFPGIDAEMRTTRGGIKTNFIVHKFLFSSYKNLLFKDAFQCEQAIDLQFKHKQSNETKIGDAYLSHQGKSIVEIGKAIISSKVQSGTAADIAYKLDEANLSLVVPVSYIEKYIGDGAILIDPLVTGSATYAASSIGSRYNSSCGFDNTCDYSMSVPTPANCTFTDVNWTYGVIAASPCGRENGGFRFKTGTCGLPTGYYWHCTDVGAGTCAGTISEWSIFRSCLPAPSCTTSNVDFTLSMFRGCVGDTGCSASCYGAYWNWVMTIEGRTIEFLNDSIQLIGKDSICAGSSIKFKTKTQNGVTGYTSTNWSFSPTGLPSLGTGDSITVNFVNKGTYTIYASAKDACNVSVQKSKTIFVDSLDLPGVITPINYCLDESASALSASKRSANETLLWYSTPSGGTGSITAPTPSTITAGTTIHYVSQKTSLGCESNRAAITVNVNPRPTAPIITTPIHYCMGATASPLSATGTSLLWYTSPTSGTGSATAPTPSTTTVGSTTYYVSQTSSLGCESPRSAITVNINPLPAAPTVVSPVTYCQAATSSVLTASGSSLLWYTSATMGTGSTTAPIPSTSVSGTTTYYVSQSSSYGCESPRSAIAVNVNPLPLAPTVTTPITYCQAASSSALTASGSSLLWYTTPTMGTGSTTAPTPSTSSSGSTTYYVSQTSGLGCEGPRSAIIVNINPLPFAPIVTTPIAYCQSATPSALTASGSSLLWYSTPTMGTGSATAPTPITTTAGSTIYYVSQTSSLGCEGPRSAITVNINSLPLAPTVTTPVTYCQSTTSSALTAAGTSLLWYTTATMGTGSASAPTPSTTTAGSTTYYVSQTSALGCEGPRSAITVNINPSPLAPIVTTPVTYCQAATPSALTASGSSLLWYTTASSGTGSTTVPTPSTSTAGSTIYYVSQTSSLGCEGPRSAITVNVNPLPLAPTVTTPVTYCQSATPSALTASGSSLLWYSTATFGTGSATAPTPSTSSSGSATYYVSQTSALGCEGPRSAITVNVNPLPLAPTVTTPITYCQAASSSALTASGSSLLWYTTATMGTGSATAPTPSTSSSGSATYYVSQTSGLGCEGPRSAITVNVNPLPLAPTVTTPVTYCQAATPSALTASGSSLLWYTTATMGTGSAIAPTPSTSLSGSTTYYVSQTSSLGCEGLRSAITVNVNPLPLAPTVTTPVTYCQSSTPSALAASGSSLLWYSTATFGTGSTTVPTPSTSVSGTTTYYVSQTSSLGCEGPRSAITVNVNPLPLAPTVTSPVNICVGIPASSLVASGLNLKWYMSFSGGVSSTTAPVPSASSVGTTNYYVSQTTALGCEGPRSTISVTVQPSPSLSIKPVGVPGFVFCEGKTVTLKGNSATAITYQWQKSGIPITGATSDTFSAGTKGYYQVTVTDIYGCKKQDSVYVSDNNLPKPILSPTDVQICEGVNIVLYCSPATKGYSYEWMKEGISMSTTTTLDNVPVSLKGNYTVKVTDIYNCVITTNESKVTTYPTIAKPNIVKVGSLLSLDRTYSNYQWYRNNKIIVGATSKTFTMMFDGTYYAEVSDVNGCFKNSDTVSAYTLSVKSTQTNAISIKIYPNPTQNIVYIESPAKVKVVVADVVGRTILTKHEATSIDLKDFADGTYFFRIFDEMNQLISVEKITKFENK